MGRRLGQHFLRDPRILDRIVDALEPEPHDVVLEIGCGDGTLTARLAPRVGRVIAIEKDPRLVPGARRAARGANVEVVEADALAVDWHRLLPPGAKGPARGAHKVIGNIPYYITSPLIEQALTPPLPAVVVFLIQKEVADRVASAPGSRTYGALSVGVQAVARAERLFVVRAGAFAPPPEVDSAVLRLIPRPEPLVSPGEHRAFRTFVTALFGFRRKQLGRSLRDVAGLERDRALAVLRGTGIDPAARAELLSPQELVALFRAVGAN